MSYCHRPKPESHGFGRGGAVVSEAEDLARRAELMADFFCSASSFS